MQESLDDFIKRHTDAGKAAPAPSPETQAIVDAQAAKYPTAYEQGVIGSTPGSVTEPKGRVADFIDRLTSPAVSPETATASIPESVPGRELIGKGVSMLTTPADLVTGLASVGAAHHFGPDVMPETVRNTSVGRDLARNLQDAKTMRVLDAMGGDFEQKLLAKVAASKNSLPTGNLMQEISDLFNDRAMKAAKLGDPELAQKLLTIGRNHVQELPSYGANMNAKQLLEYKRGIGDLTKFRTPAGQAVDAADPQVNATLQDLYKLVDGHFDNVAGPGAGELNQRYSELLQKRHGTARSIAQRQNEGTPLSYGGQFANANPVTATAGRVIGKALPYGIGVGILGELLNRR